MREEQQEIVSTILYENGTLTATITIPPEHQYRSQTGVLVEALEKEVEILVNAANNNKIIVTYNNSVGFYPRVLNTIEAARLLHVTRPELMSMIRSGEITATKTSTDHYEMNTEHILELRNKIRKERVEAQQKALTELHDLYDLIGDPNW